MLRFLINSEALGEEIGEARGKELARLDAIRNLMKSQDCTAEKVMDILNTEGEERTVLFEKI